MEITTTGTEDFLGAFLLIGLVFLGIVLLVSVVTLVSNWFLFKKAGEEGWKSLIPIYNTYIIIKLAFNGTKNYLFWIILPLSFVAGFIDGISPGNLLSNIILVISLIVNIYVGYNFMRRFADKGLSIASLFFPVFIYPIVAFSKKFTFEEYNQ